MPESASLPPLVVGTWAWGDVPYWGHGSPGHTAPSDLIDAFVEAADAGLGCFDTAEVYGHGESEKILGFLAQKTGKTVQFWSKFALLPGRHGAADLRRALEASLRRLRVPSLDLYQIHWPDRSMASIEALMGALADVLDAGLVRRVGVSNFGAEELRRAHAVLARRGHPLATNQVRHSLLFRGPEDDQTLAVCRELGVTLLAFSPLEQGVLTGKYSVDRRPPAGRGEKPWFAPGALRRVAPLLADLAAVGARHGRSPAQIALRWLLDGPRVTPVVGLTSGAQAREAAGVLSFALGEGEVAALDRRAREVTAGLSVDG
jgi:aryl-alcohol dehydrogenase-like predicted oxidoreductase